MIEQEDDDKQNLSGNSDKANSHESNLSAVDTNEDEDENSAFWGFVRLLIICHQNENETLFSNQKPKTGDQTEDPSALNNKIKNALGTKKKQTETGTKTADEIKNNDDSKVSKSSQSLAQKQKEEKRVIKDTEEDNRNDAS